jgi:hypothetical protein
VQEGEHSAAQLPWSIATGMCSNTCIHVLLVLAVKRLLLVSRLTVLHTEVWQACTLCTVVVS